MLRKTPKHIIRKLPLEPFSKKFGLDRGSPIDRAYIEKFLKKNSNKIKGTVLEIGENTYTKLYGGSKVTKSIVLHNVESPEADIVADLSTGKGVQENLADCFIFTQTLLCIYDLKETVKNTIKLLKPGGCLLLTVPGITQISRYDMNRWGHYWSFTDLSIRMLYSELVSKENIDIETFGNVKVATAFLYGMTQEEIIASDLEFHDPDYQMVIAACITK